jgi:hypothetical protein
MVELDHVFVCVAPEAPEADTLAAFGLVEGTPNTHPGQGTANRRFYFRNAMLELVWVEHEDETRSPIVAPTNLWERWRYRGPVSRPSVSACARSRPAGRCHSRPGHIARPTCHPGCK